LTPLSIFAVLGHFLLKTGKLLQKGRFNLLHFLATLLHFLANTHTQPCYFVNIGYFFVPFLPHLQGLDGSFA
jgi:hypothetical protein